MPRRLISVTVVATGALAAQAALQHSGRSPVISLSNLIGPKPEPISGVASVIFGDTIEGSWAADPFQRHRRAGESQYCGNSFPSGHAMLSAVTFLTLAALLAKANPDLRVKA